MISVPTLQEVLLLLIVILGIGASMITVLQSRQQIKKYDYRNDPFDYVLDKMPSGSFQLQTIFFIGFAWAIILIGLVGFGWVAINVPEWQIIGIIYMILALVYLVVAYAEDISVKATKITAVLGATNHKLDEQLIVGAVMGLGFGLLATLTQTTGQILQAENLPYASILISVMMVPLVEESFFRGFIAPSMCKLGGLTVGVIFSAVFFAIYHAFTYSYALPLILFAGAFGAASATACLKYKSLLPGLIAHILINGLALLAVGSIT